jgi:hypothetical protein
MFLRVLTNEYVDQQILAHSEWKNESENFYPFMRVIPEMTRQQVKIDVTLVG